LWHGFVGAAAGVEIRGGRRGVVFAEVQRLHSLDRSTDVPQWSFAVGYIVRFTRDN
jgi:hypothetical protein